LRALLRPNAKEKAKNETYLNENVVISGNIAQLPRECNLWNVSEQACLKADKGPCLLHFMGEANNAATSHLISVHFSVTDSEYFETLEVKV